MSPASVALATNHSLVTPVLMKYASFQFIHHRLTAAKCAQQHIQPVRVAYTDYGSGVRVQLSVTLRHGHLPLEQSSCTARLASSTPLEAACIISLCDSLQDTHTHTHTHTHTNVHSHIHRHVYSCQCENKHALNNDLMDNAISDRGYLLLARAIKSIVNSAYTSVKINSCCNVCVVAITLDKKGDKHVYLLLQ